MENLIWPGVVVIIAIAAIIILRAPFAGFIGRIQQIGKDGIKATSQDSRVSEGEGEKKQTQTFHQFMEIGASTVVKLQEKIIRRDLDNVEASSEEERVSMLIRSLARQQIKSSFDRINNLIFGTQLELLVHINSRPDGVLEADIRKVFENVKKLEPDFHKVTTYESYSGFLFRMNLLVREDEKILITNFGIEFMKYLLDSGLTYEHRG